MELNQCFAKAVRARRIVLRLTQRELGARLDPTASRAYVSDVENARENVTLKQVQRFAKALKCKPLQLLTAKTENEG